MTNEDTAATGPSRPGTVRRLWRWFWSPPVKASLGAVLIAGAVLGVAFWGSFNTVVEATNTEAFCLGCHEMERNVYREYRLTGHYTNRTGVRAVCSDCHVPRDWTHKMVRKVQATNELWHHFLGTIATREKFEERRLYLAERVWQTMKATDSRECRNCHNFTFMDLSAQEPRAGEHHTKAIQTGGTCIDCHKGIAHRLPKGAERAIQELERTFAPNRPKAAADAEPVAAN